MQREKPLLATNTTRAFKLFKPTEKPLSYKVVLAFAKKSFADIQRLYEENPSEMTQLIKEESWSACRGNPLDYQNTPYPRVG